MAMLLISVYSVNENSFLLGIVFNVIPKSFSQIAAVEKWNSVFRSPNKVDVDFCVRHNGDILKQIIDLSQKVGLIQVEIIIITQL